MIQFMKNSFTKSLSRGLFALYIYYANLLLGWQLVSFIYIYQSTNSSEILNRQLNWLVFQPYLIAIGATITILLLIIHRISPVFQLQHVQGLPKQVMIQNIFLTLLFINYLSTVLNVHLQVFELISFLFALWVLQRWGSVFYHSKAVPWQHPTTHGSFYISGLLTGTALLSLFQFGSIDSFRLNIILIILLMFDLFVVFSRFQFLSKSGETTNRIARNLMGRRLFHFGSRIIVGIFMPVIFILYMMLITEEEIKGVEVLILVGTYLDKYLFITSGD